MSTKQKLSGSKRKVRGSKAKTSKSSTRAPVAVSHPVTSGRTPRVTNNSTGVRIENSEYFSLITSAGTAYAVSTFSINPGVPAAFPWLSGVAQRYETYKFRSVQFKIHTRAASTQVGTVGMVFDFSATDPAPTSQITALTYHDKSADACWKEQFFRLDLAQGDKSPSRYTRNGLPAGNYDLKTYDLGNLHVFVDGVAVSSNLGLLEVCYVVDLFTPQTQNPVGGLLIGSAGLDGTHLFGTTYAADTQAILPYSVTSSSVITFNQLFEGLAVYRVDGTGLGNDLTPTTTGFSTVLYSTPNAAATQTLVVTRIRAQRGTTLTPTITATTVTGVGFMVAAASYESLSSV